MIAFECKWHRCKCYNYCRRYEHTRHKKNEKTTIKYNLCCAVEWPNKIQVGKFAFDFIRHYLLFIIWWLSRNMNWRMRWIIAFIQPATQLIFFYDNCSFDSIKPMHISTKNNPFGFMSHKHFTIKFHFPSMTWIFQTKRKS